MKKITRIIDKTGRVVIPKTIRADIGLRSGQKVEFMTKGGIVVLRRQGNPTQSLRSVGHLFDMLSAKDYDVAISVRDEIKYSTLSGNLSSNVKRNESHDSGGLKGQAVASNDITESSTQESEVFADNLTSSDTAMDDMASGSTITNGEVGDTESSDRMTVGDFLRKQRAQGRTVSSVDLEFILPRTQLFFACSSGADTQSKRVIRTCVEALLEIRE